jgi:F-type H+-transporting ATPase subunit b
LKLSVLLSRFSLKICLSVALAVSVVSFAVPVRGHAQEATPSAQSATPAEHTSAAPEEKKAESTGQQENDIFRHTPLVQSLARVFHLPVETTATLFEIFNFAIIFFCIGIPLVRVMPKIIRKRSQALKADLEEARKVSEDAKTRLGAVESKLASLDQEIAAIRSEVETEAKNDEARIKASLGEESTRIVSAAEQEISAAAAHARRGLRSFAADLAIEQASRQLNLTPETDRALIAEFVSSAASTAKGAEN